MTIKEIKEKKEKKAKLKNKIIKFINVCSYILSILFILVLILTMCNSCNSQPKQDTPKQLSNSNITDTYIVSDTISDDIYIGYRFSNDIYTYNEFINYLDTLLLDSTTTYLGDKLTFVDVDPTSDFVGAILSGWKYDIDWQSELLLIYNVPTAPNIYRSESLSSLYDNKWLVVFKDIVFEKESLNALFEGVYHVDRWNYTYNSIDMYFGGGLLFPSDFNLTLNFRGKYSYFGSSGFDFNTLSLTYKNGVIVGDGLISDTLYYRRSSWRKGFYSLHHNGSHITNLVITQREYDYLIQFTYQLNQNYRFVIDNVFQLVSKNNPNVYMIPITNYLGIEPGQYDYIFDFTFQSAAQTFSQFKYTLNLPETLGFNSSWEVYYDDISIMSNTTYPSNYDYNTIRYNGLFTTDLQLFDMTFKRITYDFNNLVIFDDDINSGESNGNLYDVFNLISFTLASFLPFFDYMVLPGLTIGVLIMIPIVITILLFVLSIFKR